MDIRDIFGVLTSQKASQKEKERVLYKLSCRGEHTFYAKLNLSKNIYEYGKDIRYDNIPFGHVNIEIDAIYTSIYMSYNEKDQCCVVDLGGVELYHGAYKACASYVQKYINQLKNIQAPIIKEYLNSLGYNAEILGHVLKNASVAEINTDKDLNIKSINYTFDTGRTWVNPNIYISNDVINTPYITDTYLHENFNIYILIREGYKQKKKATKYFSGRYENSGCISHLDQKVEYFVEGYCGEDVVVAKFLKRDGDEIFVEPVTNLKIDYDPILFSSHSLWNTERVRINLTKEWVV